MDTQVISNGILETYDRAGGAAPKRAAALRKLGFEVRTFRRVVSKKGPRLTIVLAWAKDGRTVPAPEA